MSILHAAILGLVQGLAEFLPISSSGHLILARALMGISDEAAAAGSYIIFDVLLHAGTLLALIVVFWHEWWDMILHPIRNNTLLLLIVASIPALAVDLLFDDTIETFFTGWFLGVSFLITAVFLLLSEGISNRKKAASHKPNFLHAVVMGCMQAIALLPGVSRSGSTLSGGLVSGLDRKAAARFSFMMSAPAVLGSLLFEGKSALENGYLSALDPVPTAIGVAVAAISGFLAIRFMLKLINRISLYWFALYVAIVGLAVLLVQLSGNPILPAFKLPQITSALTVLFG